MGNASAKFEGAELGEPTALPATSCIDAAPSKTTLSLELIPSGYAPWEMKTSPTIEVKTIDGTLLFTSKAGSMMKTGGKESKVTNADGKLVAVTKFKVRCWHPSGQPQGPPADLLEAC